MPKGDVLEEVPVLGPLWRAGSRPVGSVRAVATPRRAVVLTFDDGPLVGSTEGVLAALADGGATATFFVLMTRVRAAPRLLEQIVAAGHEVALHGEDHVRLTSMPTRQVVERTRRAKQELEQLVGRPVRWVRPPYGSQTPRTWAALRRAGMTPVMWGATTSDWRDQPTAERLRGALAHLRPGQIVLAHDAIAGVADGAEEREPFELDRGRFTRELLAEYAGRGFTAVSLADALADGGRLRRWAWFGR
ncbi:MULTISPECIES: polysaccharide deacetylase family protein [unclassified Actinotalea]|uniref:polysaccharide deacetylase family protein n=1 Tax=unclassified Actinotalea TaxID=2638618 RepID=UPI002107C93C|nr:MULTISPECIES: polysaccharide deacetylase family protein [unclassified Actinotalea]